jgi:elongation factor G
MQTRNIGIIAHIDAGKTTVSERFLYYSGREYRMGEVHEGNATMDWLEEEQERGITITSAATTFEWAGTRFNLIDTPGHVDFTAEVERSLRVLDGAVGVFCGVAGVEAQSETVWRQADKYGVPRIAFVNKLDRVGSDYFRVLEEIATEFDCTCLPLVVPVGLEAEFRAIVDLVEMKQLAFDEESLGSKVVEQPIDEEVRETVEMYRELLLDAVSNRSDEVMELALEGRDVPSDLLRRVIREGTLARDWIPVLGGSAFKNKGVQPLLDAVVAYLPDPADLPAIIGHDLRSGEELARELDPSAPLAALVFKVQIDTHGEIYYLRVYSGKLSKGQAILTARTGKKERIGNLYRMHAGQREQLETATAGDIVSVTGLRFSATGDTLCDQGQPILLENVTFPETVISMAIEPRSTGDRDKLLGLLERLTKEDPTFAFHTSEETGQFIISGMGELHLEVIKNRLLRDFKVDAKVGKPQVSFRQTLAAGVRKSASFERELGGKEHAGAVDLEATVDPNLAGTEVEWIEAGEGPSAWRPTIEDAVQGCLSSGSFGFPYVQLKIGLRVPPPTPQTTELGITMAIRECFDAIEAAATPVLLEPVMRVTVSTPEEYFGAINQDLIRRRATIGGVEPRAGGVREIEGTVPLMEMFGYTTTLRSLSQGRAGMSMEPIGFQAAPEEVASRYRF